MKNVMIIAASVLALGVTSPAMAADDSGVYGTLGVSLFDTDASIYGVVARAGYNVNEYFGVEAEGNLGLNSEKDFGVKIKLKSSFSGYGVARYPVSENIDIFARAGYHTTKFGGENLSTGQKTSVSDDGFAWGFGANYSFDNKNGVRLDYTRYSIGNDDTGTGASDTFSLSYIRNF